MRYSIGFKESLVAKVLSSDDGSISKIAKEAGVSDQTLRNWLNKAKEGTLDNTVSSANRSPREKLNLIIESKTISAEDEGKWLREKGLHSEHITLYEQELRDMIEDKKHSEKAEIKKLQKENKRLEKELRKKEKALAEMAALYTLKKKVDALWEDEEED